MASPPPAHPHNSGNGVSEPTLIRLRAAFDQALRDGIVGGELREALHSLGREARARGMTPERLLLLLKELWNELPAVRRAAGTPAQQTLLSRLVTMSIEEYFAEE